MAVPDQRRTAPLRLALRRIRDTLVKLTPMFESLPYRPCVGLMILALIVSGIGITFFRFSATPMVIILKGGRC